MAKRSSRFSVGSLFEAVADGIKDFAGSPNGMPARIWQEVSPWLAKFWLSAAQRWLPYLAENHPCEVPHIEFQGGLPSPCTNHAIGPCDACGRPTCIHHATVDQHGSVICYLCVGETMREKRGAAGPRPGPRPVPGAAPFPQEPGDRRPPVPMDVAEKRVKAGLKLLGLTDGAAWGEVEAKKRKLLSENHPDKQRTAAQKKAAEVRYKEVSEAYMDLERFYKKKAAA